MNYPTEDPDGDVLSTLAMQLLGVTAITSIIINHMTELDATELSGPELLQVHHDTRFVLRDILDELGARHPAAAIESATKILGDVIAMIAEDVFTDDGDCRECESRRRPRFRVRD
jgi:hypothetical protein